MNTETICTSVDTWRAVAIGPDPSVAILAFSLVVLRAGLNENTILSELLVRWNRYQMVRGLSSRSMCWRDRLALCVAVVFIEYKGVRKELPEAKHATVGSVEEEIISKKDVDFCHGKKKSKDSTLPTTCGPRYFKADRLMALGVMVIDQVAVFVVVVDHFRIVEREALRHAGLFPDPTCRPAVAPIQCSVRRHHHHRIVRFSHPINVVVDVVKSPALRIGIADIFFGEEGLHSAPVDVFRPISTFFDQCRGKDSLFAQLNQTQQHAKATVKYNNL